MLMRTDPFREPDRPTHQVSGTPARHAAGPTDAWRGAEVCHVELDLGDGQQAMSA